MSVTIADLLACKFSENPQPFCSHEHLSPDGASFRQNHRDHPVLGAAYRALQMVEKNCLLPMEMALPIVEAAAALQRIAFREGVRDATQRFLYAKCLELAAEWHLYLSALSPSATGACLDYLALALSDAFANAQAFLKVSTIGAIDSPKQRKRFHYEAECSATSVVSQARAVLEARRITSFAIVGGERRGDALRALTHGLGCDGVWPNADRHDTYRVFEKTIKETGLILALPRWARHGHIDYALKISRATDTPLVWARGGFNINSIAFAVISQLRTPCAA